MINPSVLISRIKREQDKVALSAMQYPISDPTLSGVKAGKWQGLEQCLALIEEMLQEDEEKNV